MGHFYCENISKLVVRQVYARGQRTIQQMVDFALKHHEPIHAAEGDYEDESMLCQGIEELVYIHWKSDVLQPVWRTPADDAIWHGYWDHDYDWEDPRYEEFRQIPVKFAPGGRRAYLDKKIRHLTHIEH